jgi:hypothetical protein
MHANDLQYIYTHRGGVETSSATLGQVLCHSMGGYDAPIVGSQGTAAGDVHAASMHTTWQVKNSKSLVQDEHCKLKHDA